MFPAQEVFLCLFIIYFYILEDNDAQTSLSLACYYNYDIFQEKLSEINHRNLSY